MKYRLVMYHTETISYIRIYKDKTLILELTQSEWAYLIANPSNEFK